jgi:hypothetical protein
VRIDCADLEAERECSRGQRSPDATEADDAEAGSAIRPQGPGDGMIPGPSAHAPVERHDAAHEGEKEGKRAVGHLLDAVVGDIADPDAAIGCRRHVDVVVAHAARRDDPECRQPVELGRADGLIRADEEPDDVIALPGRVGPLHFCDVADDLRDLLERVVRVADEDLHTRPSP